MADTLTIINHMLVTIGESKVNSIDSRHPSVIQAKTILDNTNYEFQSTGWWFNREYGYALAYDLEGKVSIPAECLEFNIVQNQLQYSAPDGKHRYVQRGTGVYDTVNHTDVLNTVIYADMILQRAIEELPSQAHAYLRHKAAEAMFLDDDGDPQKGNKLEFRTQEAWQRLKAAELKALAINSQDAPIVQALRYRIGQYGAPSNATYPGGRRI